MSFATIRDEVKTILETATGIGQVHDFIRHTTFWNEFFSRSLEQQRVNHWEITRIAISQNLAAPQTQIAAEPTFNDVHLVQIIGRTGLQDSSESEKAFQDLVDAVTGVLRKNSDLNQTTTKSIQPIDVIIAPNNFQGILVHEAVITFEAPERVGGC